MTDAFSYALESALGEELPQRVYTHAGELKPFDIIELSDALYYKVSSVSRSAAHGAKAVLLQSAQSPAEARTRTHPRK